MPHRLAVVCRDEIATGFRLAGLEPRCAASGEAALGALRELAAEPGAGVILMQDDLVADLPQGALAALERRPLPVLVPFPGPRPGAQAAGPEAYIVQLLQQAVGYQVRLR